MQVIVLGMHRSGTSTVSRLLNLMGLYFGAEGISTGANEENKKGFWERKDIRKLNDYILQSNNFDWYKISNLEYSHNFSEETITEFNKQAKSIILAMDAFRPWFIKEPRLCLNLDLWKKQFEIPVCIYVYRNPIEVAQSLQVRNGFPIEFGLALWEKYNLMALKQAKSVPTFFLDYNKLMQDPKKESSELIKFLNQQEIPFRQASDKEILAFIDPSLYRQRATTQSAAFLSNSQKKLYEKIKKGIGLNVTEKHLSEIDKTLLANYERIFEPGFRYKEILNEKTAIEKELAGLRKNLDSLEEQSAKQRSRVMDLEKAGSHKIEVIKAKDDKIKILEKNITEKQLVVIDRDEALRKKEEIIRQKNDEARSQSILLKTKTEDLKKKDEIIASLNSEQKKKDEEIASLNSDLQEKADSISNKRAELLNKDLKINEAFTQVVSLKSKLNQKHQEQSMIKKQLDELTNAFDELERLNKGLSKNVEILSKELINAKSRINRKNELLVDYWNQIQKSRITNRIRSVLGLENKGLAENAEKELEVLPSALISTVPVKKSSVSITDKKGEKSENRNLDIGKTIVVCWDMSHNPVGRAFLFADALKGYTDVKLVGPIFERYGDDLWPPLKKYPISTDYFKAQNFPEFLFQAKEYAKKFDDVDSIIICKPRLPSILLGLLISKLCGARFVLDIDDHELSFFKNRSKLTLTELDEVSDEELIMPFSEAWTRISENLIAEFPLKIVSNTALQKKFGGDIVPHIRNEKKFDPSKYDREKERERFGYSNEDRVILFVGTPRKHKGFLNIVDALKQIGNKSYKLCIVGDIQDKEIVKTLDENKNFVQVHPNSSFMDLPRILVIADLICLLQEVDHPITDYQMPAKFSDALSMAVPLLGTPVPPFRDLAKNGLIQLVESSEQLAIKIDEIFNHYSKYKKIAINNRKREFLKTHSYTSARASLNSILNRQNRKLAVSNELDDLLFQINRKFYSRSKQNEINPEKINIVFFWKQNDSGLYGRRSDMLVKYFAKHPNVHKIIHFDAPIGHKALLKRNDTSDESNYFQNKLIFENTVSRISGKNSQNKLFEYTFVFNESPHKTPSNEELKALSLKSLHKKEHYLNYIHRALSENNIKDSNSIFWFCPTVFQFRDVISVFSPRMIIADFIDDQRKWPQSEESLNRIEENYKDISTFADLIYCNSSEVKKSLEQLQNKEVEIITNGCEAFASDVISDWEKPEELAHLEGPIIGYVGNLDPGRLNVPLIEEMAQKYPEWNIILIGSAHMGREKILSLKRYENIKLLGVIPYEESIRYIKYFDVAIMPHYDNEMTKSMNPLKLYVYNSLSVPIVTSKVAGLDLQGNDNIIIADSSEEFIESVSKQIVGGKIEHAKLDEADSWNYKADIIINTVQQRLCSEL